MKQRKARKRVEAVLRQFSWGNYGLDEVSIGLADYPEYQEWVADLAAEIARAVKRRGHPDGGTRGNAGGEDRPAAS